MTSIILAVIGLYLICITIGVISFVGIGSHICTKNNEFREFIADINAAHDRGEL